jgi:mycoredoxin
MVGVDENGGIDAVEFYWRPGCGFCAMLDRQLHQLGIPLAKRDIWEDPDAAAFVRSVAAGNETVPTIKVGSAALVNPSPGEVVDLLRAHAPSLLPAEPA